MQYQLDIILFFVFLSLFLKYKINITIVAIVNKASNTAKTTIIIVVASLKRSMPSSTDNN